MADDDRPSEADHIPIGYVRRAHGIRGDVVVRGMISDAAERLVTGSTVTDGSTSHAITAHRPHRGDVVVHLDGIDDRTAAEALVGTRFITTKDDRRELESDEWWAEDLIGCAVIDTGGRHLGTVVDVINGAAQDRLQVETREHLRAEIPFVDPLIVDVDVRRSRIEVDLPVGLIG